jgi:rhamnulokinase
VHVIDGARNDLLRQLTADACGLPVIAGPVEGRRAR